MKLGTRMVTGQKEDKKVNQRRTENRQISQSFSISHAAVSAVRADFVIISEFL